MVNPSNNIYLSPLGINIYYRGKTQQSHPYFHKENPKKNMIQTLSPCKAYSHTYTCIKDKFIILDNQEHTHIQ